ncbi:transposase [Parathermosynechococcus lividus]
MGLAITLRRLKDYTNLIFQPPYCPEVNPIERVWRDLTWDLAWVRFDDISQLQHAMTQWICSVVSLRGFCDR